MQSNGLATLLLMIPVLTVPALAIFGIPQFAPVVASPLDEGEIDDHESRVGNSARLAHEELFDDVDAIDSDKGKPAASSLRNHGSLEAAPRSNRSRQTEPLADAAEAISESRPSRLLPENEPQSENHLKEARIPETASDLEQLSRYERSRRPSGKNTDPNRARPRDSAIKQISYQDEIPDRDTQSESPSISRSPATNTRQADVREPNAEELTWSAAVERLNELEIRNFRLEPGPKLGLFVFICSYTAPDSPTISYRFESEADQPLKAVQKVLDQIVEWRQRR